MRKVDLGRFGERQAARLLKRRGFRIIARNVHLAGGELDLVARRRGRKQAPDLVAIVEVRTRQADALVAPELTVTAPKRRRLVRAAREFIMRRRLTDAVVRFDVVGVEVDLAGRRPKVVRLELFERAFEPEPNLRG